MTNKKYFCYRRVSVIILIVVCFNYTSQLINEGKNANDSYLTTPAYVLDSYMLLMFNGSLDLHDHAEFSKVRDDHEDCIKYRGKWNVEVTNSTPYVNDYSLVIKSQNVYSAIAFGMKKPFRFESPCLVVQYDMRFPNDHDCGGAYIKLLSESIDLNLKQFSNTTPFTIMFGPDKCGIDYEIKLLFEYKDIKSGKYLKRQFKESEERYPRFLGDNVTHVNTLMICENNSVQIYRDLKLIKEGNLSSDFSPSLGGDTHVIDVNDKKPSNWDDREEIPDPNARKPDDWDESELEFIPDSEAVKPKNWLDNEPLYVKSEDSKPYDWDERKKGTWKPPIIKNYKCKVNGCGPWSPPKIRNPKYRGKWTAPLIYNPNYRGPWKPRMIENPEYIYDSKPYKNLRPFSTLGIEVWSQKPGLIFDNFLIADNLTVARQFAMHTWWPKYKVDTKDRPEYHSIFNETKRIRKSSLSAYIHWFYAIVPLLLGLPILLYISIIISKKSSRDPDSTKEKYLFKVYQNLKHNDEKEALDSITKKNYSYGLTSTVPACNISDEAINQLFGGADDKIAAVIRKRNRQSSSIELKSPAGDTL